MHLPHTGTDQEQHVGAPPDEPAAYPPSEDEIRAAEPRNLLAIASYQIVMRIGWIFKTESIVIPAFLDTIAGAGWIRGLLPVLNRVGQSAPPLFLADRVRRAARKKRLLATFMVGMAACFLLLAAIWFVFGAADPVWLTWVFLSLYAVFFVFTGLSQLASNTLQGKLIRANRRGRLMTLATTVGAVLAIGFAWVLLRRWMAIPRSDGSPGGGFAYIFAFSGVAFVLASLLVLLVREPADENGAGRIRLSDHFREAARILRIDHNFRRLVLVAMLFSTNMIIMPHYQALARVRLELTLGSLVAWVVIQNAATAIYSLFAGLTADGRGNLVVFRCLLFGTASMPLVAIGLAALGPAVGGQLYWIVFALFGMLPITLRVLTNLTLEIAPVTEHPRYLSTLSLAMAVPFVLSPLVGWLVDLTSFEAVFATAALVIATAGLLTFRVQEPRIIRKLDSDSELWAQ